VATRVRFADDRELVIPRLTAERGFPDCASIAGRAAASNRVPNVPIVRVAGYRRFGRRAARRWSLRTAAVFLPQRIHRFRVLGHTT